MKTARSLAIIWALLSLSDMVLTHECVKRGGAEINLLAQALFNQSPIIAYGVKIVITTSIFLGFWYLAKSPRSIKVLNACELILVSFYSFVIYNNTSALMAITA